MLEVTALRKGSHIACLVRRGGADRCASPMRGQIQEVAPVGRFRFPVLVASGGSRLRGAGR